MNQEKTKKAAILFLMLLGLISLLSDFTHEGARSIYGPYLGLIGVSALVISFTSGLGEFIGQALRLVTGVIADKTKKYWAMMFIGYALNLLVIPLLMFVDASIWEVAIILILLERVGKGIRAPAKSALTSFTAPHLGAGKSFAIQEAMDQFGAFLGPIFVFVVLSFNQVELRGYQMAFGLLGIFAILTLVILFTARFKYPHPDEFESKKEIHGLKGNKAFAFYMIAIALIALGFIDYPVLAYHISDYTEIDVVFVPLLYALAMGIDAVSALLFGQLYDKKGVVSLIIAIAISALITPVFFFVEGIPGILFGVALWGIGMGAQESILKAVVSTTVSKEKRATAYGVFYTVFGSAWFLGSLIIGWLYGISILYLVLFASGMEILAVILLLVYKKKNIFSLKENAK